MGTHSKPRFDVFSLAITQVKVALMLILSAFLNFMQLCSPSGKGTPSTIS